MRVQLSCYYCGNIWIETIYGQSALNNKRCPICNDRHLKHRDMASASVDYYIGCPPFPEEKKKDDDEHSPYWMSQGNSD